MSPAPPVPAGQGGRPVRNVERARPASSAFVTPSYSAPPTAGLGDPNAQIANLKSQRTNGGEAVTTPPPRGAPSKPNRCLLLWDARHGLLRARVQDDAGTPSATDKGAADLGLRPPPARPSVPTGALGACHVTVGPTRRLGHPWPHSFPPWAMAGCVVTQHGWCLRKLFGNQRN